MGGLPAQVLDSPLLVDFKDQIDRKLEAERRAREIFRSRAGDGLREEFINGEVIEQVPTRDQHMACLDNLHLLISTFVRLRKQGAVRREQALTEFPRNDYCPDLCYWTNEASIGIDPNQTIYPPPAFVIEVASPSTVDRDRGVKFQDYEAHGVQEYWIVDPEKRTIEQYVIQNDGYEMVPASADGRITSRVIAGFSMPAAAAFDDAAQLAALQAIMNAR